MRGLLTLTFAVVAGLPMACASAPAGEGTTAVQFIDIRNDSPESVVITARVGASEEQRLGLLEPTQFRRFEITTGAATDDMIFLRARNPETGREDTATLQVAPGETLEWSISL